MFKDKKKEAAGPTEPSPAPTPMEIDEIPTSQPVDYAQIFKDNVSTLIRAVELDDRNLIRRVWRRNTALRRHLPLAHFQDMLLASFPAGDTRNKLLHSLDPAFAASSSSPNEKLKDAKINLGEEPLLEVEAYFHLFIIAALSAQRKHAQAVEACEYLLQRFKRETRATLDSFVAKTYTFYSLSLENLPSSSSHLPELVAGHRTAVLRLYEQSQATLINLVLRFHVLRAQYEQARLFDAQAAFPLDAPATQEVRHLFYAAKCHAVTAEYSKADELATRAVRKCPANTAAGFRRCVTKLSVVVKLLMGEVPERVVFKEEGLAEYLELVKAVRSGSVQEYNAVVKKFATLFEGDGLLTLVDRLRSSVIKTGLRNINIAYSRISFKDIKEKLGHKDDRAAELVCAKAIRDGIIDSAVIDHASGCLISTEKLDVYSTSMEPKKQFNQRIDFCVNVHNAALKAHRYPPNSHKAKKDAGQKEEEGDVASEIMDLLDDLM